MSRRRINIDLGILKSSKQDRQKASASAYEPAYAEPFGGIYGQRGIRRFYCSSCKGLRSDASIPNAMTPHRPEAHQFIS
jgi:hypothetical protein